MLLTSSLVTDDFCFVLLLSLWHLGPKEATSVSGTLQCDDARSVMRRRSDLSAGGHQRLQVLRPEKRKWCFQPLIQVFVCVSWKKHLNG